MSEHKKIPVILDGDPGHDDAIAWVLARASRELGILAVTSCCGNQTIEKTTYNALRVCTLIGLHAPVGKGCPHPLLNDVMNAPSVHGESGLDGPALPEPAFEASALSAPELMAKVLRESPEPVTIVATGPQTNVAALLLAHPELKCKIACISLMGGGIATGNWTPAAEFNILVDPEAARIVFTSGVPITMAGLDVTEKALILPEDGLSLVAVSGDFRFDGKAARHFRLDTAARARARKSGQRYRCAVAGVLLPIPPLHWLRWCADARPVRGHGAHPSRNFHHPAHVCPDRNSGRILPRHDRGRSARLLRARAECGRADGR